MRMSSGSLGVERMDTSTRSSPLSISTIGEDLTITGNVTSKGELHLNGQIQGDVHCVALVLGENAQLEGERSCGGCNGPWPPYRLGPCATGDVAGRSHVEGNLFHKSLSIEQGTHFEGESRPSEDPLVVQPRSTRT